jgi:predicted nucleic acid-binding protein
MKKQILVDTSVIVQYLKSGKGKLPEVYEKYEMLVSTVTLTELLASKTFSDTNLLNEVLEFVDKYFTVKEANREIASRAAEIIRDYEASLATAYISATAIENELPLLTENEKEYSNIKNIEFYRD